MEAGQPIGAFLLIGAGLVAIVVWYMRRPNFTRLRVSAARFLPDFKPPQAARSVWKVAVPLMCWRFYLRLLLGGLLLASLLQWAAPQSANEALRIAIVADVSHSMTAAIPDMTGREVLSVALAKIADRLSALDPPPGSCIVFREAGASVRERILTEPGQLRRLRPEIQQAGAPAATLLAALRRTTPNCLAPQTIVITDLPMPAIPEAADPGSLIWIDVSQIRSNVGIAAVSGLESVLEAVSTPVVEIAGYGSPPGALTLGVETQAGQQIYTVDTTGRPPWRIPIGLPSEGAVLTLTPGGAYSGDDRASVRLGAGQRLVVDWRLSNIPMPSFPGWLAAVSGEAADLRVVEVSATEAGDFGMSDIPTVFVYPGLWSAGSAPPGERLGLFIERNPLLLDVNLDLLELSARPPPEMDPTMTPILRDARGDTIVAFGAAPRRVVIPGPVAESDDQISALSLTLLFNALRWAQDSDTSDAELQYLAPDGTVIEDAFFESNTFETRRSAGSLEALALSKGEAHAAPLWPWFVFAATLILLAERVLGVAWRRGV
jgi:hypothetical protein